MGLLVLHLGVDREGANHELLVLHLASGVLHLVTDEVRERHVLGLVVGQPLGVHNFGANNVLLANASAVAVGVRGSIVEGGIEALLRGLVACDHGHKRGRGQEVTQQHR